MVKPSEITDLAGMLRRLLDPDAPFDLYFCVQERELPSWRVRRPERRPRHLLYVPASDPLVGTVEGAAVRVEPGEVLWVQPEARFELAASSALARPSISLGVCRFDLLGTPIQRLAEPFRIGRRPDGEGLLDDLMPGAGLDERIDALLQRAVLARILARCFAGGTTAAAETGLKPAVRARLAAFMSRHLHHRVGVRELADEVGMNPAYLSRCFRFSFGAAPRRYLLDLRLRRAASFLLASDDPIGVVAERFGYGSVFLFSRQFRQVLGHSPTAWRRRAGAR